jgi:hypothetical protein|tara:strand:+ start:2130 stop:2585 length:456 start_codon:yes stop_codon:yes gene_type:complete
MSLTRFNDDDARVKKRLQESLSIGLYQLDAPGPGPQTPFIEDIHIRLQKWGANLHNNTIELENDFRNMNNRLSNNMKNYKDLEAVTSENNYPDEAPFIDESRASLPAWTFRDMESNRWEYPLHDTQKNIERPFIFNEQSRISLKDNFVRKL